MTRARLRRYGLRAAAFTAMLCAVGCQAFIDPDGSEYLKHEDGADCEDGAQCLSGFCVDGACCDSECDDACEACDGLHTVDRIPGECGALDPVFHDEDGC